MIRRSKARLSGILGVLQIALATFPSALAQEPPALTFRDDLGAPVPGLEVCFQVRGARRCSQEAPDAAVRWPARATGVWAGGPGHGPVWVEREGGTAGEVVVPRKAELSVEGVPAGATLSFYRANDRAFAAPLDHLRVLDPERPVLAPSGPMVLAIRSRSSAPDLHRLDAPPGGAARVRHAPRAGWSAILRTRSRIEGRPLASAAVRWIESSPTAPHARLGELAVVETGGAGLVLLSGIEAPMASAEVTHGDHAPVTLHGLTAPQGGLLYQEAELRPGGTVAASVLWRGEPAAGLGAALFVQPTDPDRKVAPSEVALRGRLDDDGRLRVEHVPEGDYLLRLSAPEAGGIDAHADLVLRVDDRRVTEVTADLHPRTIRGRVTRPEDGEEGVPGYRLHARIVRGVTDLGDTDRQRAVVARTAQGDVTTDEDGRYALTLLADGVYVVALHTLDGTSIASRAVRVEGGDAEASFRLASESLSGRVVSSRGGAVGDAEVIVRWGGGSGRDRLQTTRTDPDGRFEIPFEADRAGIAPLVAHARKDGWLGDRRAVDFRAVGGPRFESFQRTGREGREGKGTERDSRTVIEAPAAPWEIELTLHPLEAIRGRVVDAAGRPIPGAWVASCRDQPGSPLTWAGSARTAEDGTFEVPSGVADGAPPPRRAPVRLYVSAPGCPLTERVVEPSEWPQSHLLPGERAEPVPPVTIVCDTPPAVLRTHVAFSRSHPLPGERLTLRRNGRVVLPRVLDGHLNELGLPRTTGEDGQLLLVLAPGRWGIYRASDAPVGEIRSGSEEGLLGTVALDPWTVTDLYAGTDE